MTIVNSKDLFDKQSGESDLTKIVYSMIARSDNGIVTLAPGIAWRILDELNFEGQRKVKKARFEARLNAIRSGTWDAQMSTILIAVLPNGAMVLIDGQHRLYAIYTHDAPVPTGIKLVNARDDEHLKRLYALCDMKDSSRTESELLSASGLAEIIGIKFKTAEVLLKAVAIIENRMEPELRGSGKEPLRQFDFRSEKAAYWEREAREFDEVLAIADAPLRAKLRRAGTMAVALYTLKHSREKALRFWKGMAENDGLRKHDPRSRLLTDLLTRSIAHGSTRQSVQQPAVAWNAFFEGRDLKIIKCIEGSDIVIQGTPMRKGGAK
ncbi:hypothetical protein [Halomonas sp. hl-4]|uniref:hypothetical protein n=1 Tax=Halomonas sp. hl-4 TaxID=1761789 RepID=UPI000BB7848F|nr:hypothetical protein [Halomonas sp. hl-4]SNY95537.1 hypothetical protein SAMN04488142_0037 [Halomonas sp. hl-4]